MLPGRSTGISSNRVTWRRNDRRSRPSITTTLPQFAQFLVGNRSAGGKATKLASAWAGSHGDVLKILLLRTVVVILEDATIRILRERDAYYHALENATRGTCDITAWLSWFAGCLGRAMDDALEALSVAERNAALRERAGGQLPLNPRQLRVLELLIREPEETLTATRWARINHSTREEAEADIDGMVQAMLLEESPQESINPRYRLARGR